MFPWHYSYNLAQELRQRMDPALFVTTVGTMDEVSSAIENYISYAEMLTGRESTSPFALIEHSLKAFYDQVFRPDYEPFSRYESFMNFSDDIIDNIDTIFTGVWITADQSICLCTVCTYKYYL